MPAQYRTLGADAGRVKIRWVAADTTSMQRTRIAAVLVSAVVVAACGSATDGPASVVPEATSVPVDGDAVASTVPPAGSTTTVPAGPEYDVFLAAVGETLEGTRFEGLPFEEPEVFAATGLLLCERLEDGVVEDQVIVEYLSELADGDLTLADDDQLVLAGALMGAAETALCPYR